MDPLDPLTEIVKSGQGISPFIFLERLLWLFIGFFFIGAMTSGLKNGWKDQDWILNKKNNKKNTLSNKDHE